MTDLADRIETLEREHAALSERVDVLTDFMMNTIALVAEEEDSEALRDGLIRLIATARQTGRYDTVNHAQYLLRAFEVVFAPR